MESAFGYAGIKNAKVNETCLLTSNLGHEAADWLETVNHKATVKALLDDSVKVLYLSLGGNDSLNSWNRSFDQKQMYELATKIKNDIAKIVNVYRTLRPDIKIIVSGYDYPRFEPNHPLKFYRDMYGKMGSPSYLEINQMLIKFSAIVADLADNESVFYLHHIGLMHYYFGNEVAGLPPFSTAPPELISPRNNSKLFGGFAQYSSDIKAMQQIDNLFIDSFHLTSFGYDRIADHAMNTYIKYWLDQ